MERVTNSGKKTNPKKNKTLLYIYMHKYQREKYERIGEEQKRVHVENVRKKYIYRYCI